MSETFPFHQFFCTPPRSADKYQMADPLMASGHQEKASYLGKREREEKQVVGEFRGVNK